MKTAIEFIQEAKEKNLEFLDLGNLGLTELPDELFELKNLKSLNLGTRYYQSGEWKHSVNSGKQNIIKWIPWRIKRLSELRYLSMYATYSGDIHGLQGLPRLTHLDLSFNYQIRDFASLRFLRKLQYLSVNTTQIPDLSSITAFKHLKFLDISYNWLKSFDSLKGFRKLSTLLLANTLDDLIDLGPLRNLDDLSHLDLGANKLANLKSLSGIKLEYLGLFGAGIANLDFLEGQENLKKLTLWKNELTNVDVLSQLRLLEDLNLRENSIEDVSALASLPYLKRLDIAQNPISDISKLKEKANLNLIC